MDQKFKSNLLQMCFNLYSYTFRRFNHHIRSCVPLPPVNWNWLPEIDKCAHLLRSKSGKGNPSTTCLTPAIFSGSRWATFSADAVGVPYRAFLQDIFFSRSFRALRAQMAIFCLSSRKNVFIASMQANKRLKRLKALLWGNNLNVHRGTK